MTRHLRAVPRSSEPLDDFEREVARIRRRALGETILCWIGFAGLVLAFVIWLAGCASSLVSIANASREVGETAAGVVHDVCTVPYAEVGGLPEAERAAAVAKIDAVCLPLVRAFDLHRSLHAALVAALQAGDEASALTLAAQLQEAARELVEALAAVSQRAR